MTVTLRLLARAIATATALLACTGAWAQSAEEITVEAVLEETQVAVGVTTYLQLIVQGGQPEVVPNQIPAEGLTIGEAERPPASNYYHPSVNGVVMVQAKYLYPVVATSPGTYTIAPIKLRIRGREYASNPVTIEIVKLSGSRQQFNSSQPYFLTFQATKTEAYVNELIPVELGLYVRGNNSIARPGRPKFNNSGKFVVKPFPTSYRLNPEQIDGIPFSNVRFPTQIAALAPGTHLLGPASVETEIAKSGNDAFPRLMRGSEPRTISSNDLSFTIKPLPTEGRPASFLGAVGSFELEVEATPRELRAGDPLSVEIRVHGNGNFDSLTPPQVPETAGWRTYPVTEIDLPEGNDSQSVTFAQVIIPLEKHDALPPIGLTFFDPAKETYVTLQAPPVPLRIIPDPAASAAAGQVLLSQIGIQGEQLDDILFIHTGNPSWRPVTGSLVSRPSFWAWQLLPISALCGIVGGWGWRRWTEWQEARRLLFEVTLEKVKARAHESLSRPEFYALVLDYFERWRVHHPQLPATLSPRSRESIERMIQAGNSLLYAGDSGNPAAASQKEKQEVLSALAELESLAPIA